MHTGKRGAADLRYGGVVEKMRMDSLPSPWHIFSGRTEQEEDRLSCAFFN